VQYFTKVEDIQHCIEKLKISGKSIGFVPTMGALHQGHISLIQHSKAACDICVASIFVNPTQFNNQSDFQLYPRMIEEDSQKLLNAGCNILFLPEVDEMYQNAQLEITPIDIGYLDTILEGINRPGHYIGVATIVEKLFHVVQPDKVYMGLKDFQQVKVIEKLVRDKAMPIEIVGCPTMREENGLAMSSRNLRLSLEGKQKAGQIYQTLKYIEENKGSISPDKLLNRARSKYLSSDIWEIEYLEIRNAYDLSEVNMEIWDLNLNYVVLFAGWLEGIRLIDNMSF